MLQRSKKLSYFSVAIGFVVACLYGFQVYKNLSNEIIFKIVISDLVSKPSDQREFINDKVLVINEFRKGNSLYFDTGGKTGEGLKSVFPEFISALENASKSNSKFPDARLFGNSAIVTSKRPPNAGEGSVSERFEGRSMVKFWRPGFSEDSKKAIVRVWRGPQLHDEVVTYVLKKEYGIWRIIFSAADEYP
jgi:hypothetical protein